MHKITLYDPKSTTWHVKIASRPTATVTLAIGAENLGSVKRETLKVVGLEKTPNELLRVYLSRSLLNKTLLIFVEYIFVNDQCRENQL